MGHSAEQGALRAIGTALTVAYACLLAGCATGPSVAPVTPQALPPAAVSSSLQRFTRLQALPAFALEAKLAVQYADKGYTARLQWQHTLAEDHLQIYSPLGQQVAEITRNDAGVSLTDQAGKVHHAADVDGLTERLLGWRLPLAGLSVWVLAAPRLDSPYQINYLAATTPPLPAAVLQDQWQINYDEYRPTMLAHGEEQLPSTIRLQQQTVRLKLVIQHWAAETP